MSLVFFCPGKAAPGGSKTAHPFQRKDGSLGASMQDAGKNNGPWKQLVGLVAMQAMGNKPLYDGPLSLNLVFFRSRPKGHFRKNGTLHEWAKDEMPTTTPDLLKTARAVEDGCNKIVWTDDARIVHEVLDKKFVDDGEKPGVSVWVRKWEKQA